MPFALNARTPFHGFQDTDRKYQRERTKEKWSFSVTRSTSTLSTSLNRQRGLVALLSENEMQM